MNTQTIERKELHNAIDALPDNDIGKLVTFVEYLKYAGARNIPNAETIEAIEELRAGGGKKFSSIEALMQDLHDDEDD